MVIGDITLENLMPLAEKFYAPLTPRDVPSRTAHTEPLRSVPVRLVEVDKAVQVPVFYKMYRTPSVFQGVGGGAGDAKGAVALAVLAEVLGGNDSARLYKKLVIEDGLADGASTDYDGVAAAETSLDISVTPKDGVALDKIETAVNELVAQIVEGGITEAELKRARTNMLADYVYSLDDTDNVHYRLGSWLLAGGKPEQFDVWMDTLKALTVADVTFAARAFVQEKLSTTGILVGKASQLGSLKPEAPEAVLSVVN
jgi:zinc protease